MSELDALFKQSKEIIISEMKEGVRLFDTSRPTCLATDWSWWCWLLFDAEVLPLHNQNPCLLP